jgi:hypothetical protein
MKTKAKSNAKAKAKTKTAPKWSTNGNARSMLRRKALGSLNKLAEEIGATTISAKTAKAKRVEKLIKVLQRRLAAPTDVERLREAALSWVANGGRLEGKLLIAPTSCTGDDAPDVEEATEGTLAFVPRHKVLVSGFRLRSRAFMLTYNSKAFRKEWWTKFKAFIVSVAQKFTATAWAACVEKSSASLARRYHGHAYFFWLGGEELCFRDLEPFVFEDIHPRVDVCYVTNPSAFRAAAEHGLWYVAIMKLGTLAADTNWRKYTPKKEWLVKLWEDKKLTHDQFEAFSAEFRGGHSARMRDLEAVRRTERSLNVVSHVAREVQLLEDAKIVRPAKVFPEVEHYVSFFAPETILCRRPLLAIIAGTNSGKSLLGADVLKRIAKLVGVESFLEVTVEGDGYLDLSRFDVARDAGVLLDGVGDASLLASNREVLQGRAKVCQGGKSATMMYAYDYTLTRRAVVATFDLSAKNLDLFQTHHWLSDPANVVVFNLKTSAWVGGPDVIAVVPSSNMRTWDVDAVVAWLTRHGMCTAAAIFHANAVDGVDLMSFKHAAHMEKGLRLTPFLAAKIMKLRCLHVASV